MNTEKVINGLVAYIKTDLYPTMNEWQKLIAADVISRALRRTNELKAMIENNSFAVALGYIDTEGNVDVDGIMTSIKNHVAEKGKFEFALPLMPTYRFTAEDVEKLHRIIKGE